MRPIAIEHNLRRLTFFLHSDGGLKCSAMAEIDEFMANYAHIMDLHGCGNQQLSRLYLESQDFEELRKWAENKEGYQEKSGTAVVGYEGQLFFPKQFKFWNDQYYWTVFEIVNYFKRN